jgi:phosphoribosyl 1,2-cyclic phosphodiesterase
MSLMIQFWGIRGSLPFHSSPSEIYEDFRQLMFEFFNAGFSKPQDYDVFLKEKGLPNIGGYGVSTTCVSVNSADQQIIIDAGTGIRTLGKNLIDGACKQGKGQVHIFMTHFHWDHVIGLPFFDPLHIDGNEINIYSVQHEVSDYINLLFESPFNPSPLKPKAKFNFHLLEPRKPFQLNDITLTPYQLDHPDPCWGYKIESNGKVYSHCTDTEATRVSRKSLNDDLPLYQNVDLMFFDGQYTLKDLAEKINWGHSAAQIGLDLAFREGIKHVLFSHHDPLATAHKIKALERQTTEYYNWRIDQAQRNQESLPKVRWAFAHEGQVIIL